ncbi:hypothetical protein FBY41_1733 [Humibacillus xanthopallidus]|uniref:Uncharacterized protein n=2 Tax=Humibacillus xanthopallidus TaxID=412689 RepID=A0A543HTV9_9MICO|nr:hypothetical protein FBY41_1733 [Humibacillus xanthopallidus]
MLRPTVEGIALKAWSRAAQLPQSSIADGKVEVPSLCGRHFIRYPIALLEEAMRGRFYTFALACECHAYLIQTTGDSVRFKAAGDWEEISVMYEDLPGEEFLFRDQIGPFVCKKLPSA